MFVLRRSAVVAVVAMVMAFAVAVDVTAAQPLGPAPAPAGGIGSECMNSVLNMSDCLTYVESGSTARKPDKPCCPELAGLLDSNPVCLCELLGGAAESYGISIDYNRALALPGICHISTPPISTCAAIGIPVHLGPSPAQGSSPSGGPQLPGTGTAPFASPPTTASNAVRRFAAGDFIALAVLPLAAAAAGMF